jgi:hypothetical protein
MNHYARHLAGSLIALAAVGLLEPTSASAQSAYDQPPPPPPGGAARGPRDRFQIGGQVGWLFGASIDVPNGEVGLNGNWAYTGNADFRLTPTTLVEARYTFFPTEVEFHPFVGVDEDVTEIDVHCRASCRSASRDRSSASPSARRTSIRPAASTKTKRTSRRS